MAKKNKIKKSYLKIVIIEDDSKREIKGDFQGTLSDLEAMLFSMAEKDCRLRTVLFKVADDFVSYIKNKKLWKRQYLFCIIEMIFLA